MNRIGEIIRDPKWIAVGLTAAVLAGGIIKFAWSPEAKPQAAAKRPVAADRQIDIAPGSYEILHSSWDKSGTSVADRAADRDSEDTFSAPLRTDEEERFLRRAHKTWSGICIAVQQRQ